MRSSAFARVARPANSPRNRMIAKSLRDTSISSLNCSPAYTILAQSPGQMKTALKLREAMMRKRSDHADCTALSAYLHLLAQLARHDRRRTRKRALDVLARRGQLCRSHQRFIPGRKFSEAPRR